MTSASMTFGRPARLAIPRGSLWFGNLAAALIALLRRADAWLLRQQAQQQEPASVQGVLEWANRIEATQPGFAADLRGAALRSDAAQDR